jgi:WD40 repeat protein
VSGSWDTTLKVWSLRGDSEDESAAPKRQRTGDSGAAPAGEQEGAEARMTLEGHSQCVCAVEWSRENTIHSASWDHSVRTWDVQAAVNTSTIVSYSLWPASLSRTQPEDACNVHMRKVNVGRHGGAAWLKGGGMFTCSFCN